MALSFENLLFLTLLLLFVNIAISTTPPTSIVIPVTKDSRTSLYTLKIKHGAPLVPVRLAIDLGGPHVWVDVETNYASSTYAPARCGSTACWLARATSTCNGCAVNSAPRPGCNNNTCTRQAVGPDSSFRGEVGLDVFNFLSTDGKTVGPSVSIPDFIFTCAFSNYVRGLPVGVVGIAGLGSTLTSLPSQISRHLSRPIKFALCLGQNGGVFFSSNNIFMLPDKKITSYLTYTSLIRKIPNTNHIISPNYYISINSIKFNGKNIQVNKSLLSIDSYGRGGTKISTMVPYTALHSSIYKTLVDTVTETLSGIPRVAPVKPFGLCFNATHVGSTRVGPTFPPIELVLQNGVVWTVFSGNSLKRMGGDALCLAFVNGGRRPKASIVIGLHQIEDNLLEFDLEKSRLGFSSSLLFAQTTCSNFNFTSAITKRI